MSKKACFTRALEEQLEKWVETLLQSEWLYFGNIYLSLWMQLHWKKSFLVINKILRLFVNTLTVDDYLYLLNRDNLTQPIQMQKDG